MPRRIGGNERKWGGKRERKRTERKGKNRDRNSEQGFVNNN